MLATVNHWNGFMINMNKLVLGDQNRQRVTLEVGRFKRVFIASGISCCDTNGKIHNTTQKRHISTSLNVTNEEDVVKVA